MCPICKNRRLNYLVWSGQKYECKRCGYVGVLAIEEDVDKILKKSRKIKK